jgi:hypothetical protein
MELVGGETIGEDVYNLIEGRQISSGNILVDYFLTNEMVVHLNMFSVRII